MTGGFCPHCGAARQGGAFCSSCGAAFEAAPGGGSIQQGLAGGLLEIEQMRLKLIPFRIIGIVLGLAVWYLVVGPNMEPLLTLIALPVLAFGGLYVGNIAALYLFSGRR